MKASKLKSKPTTTSNVSARSEYVRAVLNSEPRVRTPECYEPENFITLAEQKSGYFSASKMLEHMTTCAYCRGMYSDVWNTLQVTSQASPADSSRDGGLSSPLKTMPTLPALTRPLRAGRMRWAVTAATIALLIILLPRFWTSAKYSPPALVKGIPYENAIRLPDWTSDAVAMITRTPDVSRGASVSSGTAIRLLRPLPGNTAVNTTDASFEWQSVEHAASYDVRLSVRRSEADDFHEVKDAFLVLGTSARLKPGFSFHAGDTCQLRVQANVSMNNPAGKSYPLKAEYLFRVLTASEQHQAEWAKANLDTAPVTSGMALYQLGLYADAVTALKHWPHSEALDGWSQAILQAKQAHELHPSQP